MITQILLLINAILYLGPSLLDGTLDPTTTNQATPNYTSVMNWGAFRSLAFDNGEYYRLISSMFLHWGLIHFIFNMVSLYQLGPDVEQIFGNARMLIIYLAAGIFGGLATYFFGSANSASAGASGAIFGLVGALISYFLLNPSAVSSQILPQLFIVTAINLVYGFSSPNIGNAAHIGGLVAGLAIGFVFGR